MFNPGVVLTMKAVADPDGGYILQCAKNYVRPEGGLKQYTSQKGFISDGAVGTQGMLTSEYHETREWKTEERCLAYAVILGELVIENGIAEQVLILDEHLFIYHTIVKS